MAPPFQDITRQVVVKKNVLRPVFGIATLTVGRVMKLTAVAEFGDISWTIQRASQQFHRALEVSRLVAGSSRACFVDLFKAIEPI